MKDKLRFGVVGAGKIAEVLHVPNILLSEYCELVAISDPNTERLEYMKKKFSLEKVHIYERWEDMVNDSNIDAVVVCTPNYLHSAVSIRMLGSGKHVLVEKPMAINSAEAESMIDAARRSGRVLMVNHSQRFFPHNVKAREIVESGMLGEIRLVKTMFGHAGPENWSKTAHWFFEKDRAMFGALGDLGVHKVDLIRFLTGLEIVECSAFADTLEKTGDVEDISSAVMRLSNKALATLDANWITKGLEENYIVVYGEFGTMKVGQTDPSKIELFLSKPVAFKGEIALKPLFTNEDPYWKLPIVEHFAKVCLGLEKPIVEAKDGYKALLVIEKLVESIREKRVVRIDEH